MVIQKESTLRIELNQVVDLTILFATELLNE